jgi:hypothetical protein
MTLRLVSRSAFLAMVFAFSGAAAAADDPKTPSSSSPTPPTSSTTYLYVGDIVGEVVKVDSSSITVRITWYTLQAPKGRGNFGHWGRGSVARNPQQMYQHQLQMQQRLMRQMASAKPKENHKDYTMPFADDATARIKHLPPKIGDDGKKIYYSLEEVAKLKGGSGLPGYKADLSELKVGQVVEAHIVRLPKKEDLIVRWALILNEDHAKDSTVTSNKKK